MTLLDKNSFHWHPTIGGTAQEVKCRKTDMLATSRYLT
jgi:hypothetical protein